MTDETDVTEGKSLRKIMVNIKAKVFLFASWFFYL